MKACPRCNRWSQEGYAVCASCGGPLEPAKDAPYLQRLDELSGDVPANQYAQTPVPQELVYRRALICFGACALFLVVLLVVHVWR